MAMFLAMSELDPAAIVSGALLLLMKAGGHQDL